jgi:hypothetical protein
MRRLAVRTAAGAAVIVAGAAVFGAGAAVTASGSTGSSSGPVTRGYTANLSYRQTSAGTNAPGGAMRGVTGAGAFSAALGPRAALLAAVFQAVTKVPVTEMAKGGPYATRFDVDAKGNKHGLILVTFKVATLGKTCLSFTEKVGTFHQGMSFVPVSGAFTTVGGTGRSARFHVSGTFDQTDVTGSTVERFIGKGSAKAALGSSRSLSAACKALAGLPHA